MHPYGPKFSDDHDDLDGEDDFHFDDGLLHGLVTIVGRHLTIHDVEANDSTLHGARSGVGRKSLKALRSDFDEIFASGVLHPFGTASPREPDLKSLLFWVAMLREGLIDKMVLMNCSTEFTAADLGRPVETTFGTLTLHRDRMFELTGNEPNLVKSFAR